jgi:hypothetical protein
VVSALLVRGIASVSSSKADKHGKRQESGQQNWEEDEEEEEACLSRSETSRRPGSRARCCAGFASNLRQLTSTMTGECSDLFCFNVYLFK